MLGPRLPGLGPQTHLGGGPVHPAFCARVHVDEDQALHHLRVVQLQFKTQGKRDDPARSNERWRKGPGKGPCGPPEQAAALVSLQCPPRKTEAPAQWALDWVSEGSERGSRRRNRGTCARPWTGHFPSIPLSSPSCEWVYQAINLIITDT